MHTKTKSHIFLFNSVIKQRTGSHCRIPPPPTIQLTLRVIGQHDVVSRKIGGVRAGLLVEYWLVENRTAKCCKPDDMCHCLTMPL